MISHLKCCNILSCDDLAIGYWLVSMPPEDSEKTTFISHLEQFEWIVMPFGLSSVLVTFMSLMEQIVADIVWNKDVVSLEDIVAFGGTFKDALMNFESNAQKVVSSTFKVESEGV